MIDIIMLRISHFSLNIFLLDIPCYMTILHTKYSEFILMEYIIIFISTIFTHVLFTYANVMASYGQFHN